MKYTIIKPEYECGICGCIWQALRGIFHTPNEEYYFDFFDSRYQVTPGTINVWDYYFEQPFVLHKPLPCDIKQTARVIFDDPESNFIHEEIIPQTPENIQARRQTFNSIYNQYFKLKKDVQDKIDSFYNEHMLNKKVLGVHFRGTDHPYKQNMDKALQAVRETINFYDKLFICSDEYYRYKLASDMFSSKAIAYNSIRSESPKPLHVLDNNDVKDADYFKKIAEDVIIEAVLMSKTDFLICCPGSNVNYLARAINPNLNSLTVYE